MLFYPLHPPLFHRKHQLFYRRMFINGLYYIDQTSRFFTWFLLSQSIVAEQPIRPLAQKNPIKLKRIQNKNKKRSKIVTISTNQTSILNYFDRIIPTTKDSLDRPGKQISDMY